MGMSDRNPRFTNGGGIALVLICAVIYTTLGILIGRLIWG